MKKIIAFYGPQQAGKSSAADAVAAWQGWTKLSFAGPLYAMLEVIVPGARSLDKNEPLYLLEGKSIRQALQLLGTEYGRGMLGEAIWIRNMKRRIAETDTHVVIDDLRFRNEYEFLHDIGALIIRVNRGETGPGDAHASEADWPSFEPDLTFHNSFGDAQEWQQAVRGTLRGVGILD